MMGEWASARLGQAAEVVMGHSPPSGGYNGAGRGLPLLNGPTEFGARFPTPVQWTEVVTRVAEPGDILLCVRGSTTGRQNVADQRYCIGRGLAAIRGRSGISETGFLQYVLQRLAEEVLAEARGAGSTFPNISRERLEDRTLLLPLLPEQRKIAAILSSVDDTLERTQAVIDQLEVVKKQLLEELLARGLPGEHRALQETEIGLTPAGWTVMGLLEVVSLPTGQVDPRQEPYRHWPLVAPNHIEPGTGRLLAKESAALQGAVSGKYPFRPGDVLYSKIRPYLRKAVLVDFEGLCSADMYPLRPSARVVPEFLLAVLLSERFTEFASSVSMRTGIPKLNREELAQYRLALPPRAEQAVIASAFATLFERRGRELAYLQALQEAKAALLDTLLAGKVRVSVSAREPA